jgi:hypothetical protein
MDFKDTNAKNAGELLKLINSVSELNDMIRDGYSIEDVKDQARFMLEATGFDGFYADIGSAEKVLLRKIIRYKKR